MQGDTAKTIKHNHQLLKTTLQKTGDLPPDRPQILNYEQYLISEVNSNPYAKALLYMMLAINK